MKQWMAVCLLFVVGCVTPMSKRQFIPIGAPIQVVAKQPSDVQVFSNPTQVPYSYNQIGRITPEGNIDNHEKANAQIVAIRQLAADSGADAVILSKQILVKGGMVHSPEEGVVHRAEIALYSGIAIVRTSTASAVLPTSNPSEVVSIGDLFAVPDHYLNKTIIVEGIYSQLTVGTQATGFLLTSPVNSQLELLCAYRNIELDQNSRRSLMNKPNKASLRIEGHLVPSAQGSAKDANLSSPSGYELAVTNVLQ
jgi:hypothetical protein